MSNRHRQKFVFSGVKTTLIGDDYKWDPILDSVRKKMAGLISNDYIQPLSQKIKLSKPILGELVVGEYGCYSETKLEEIKVRHEKMLEEGDVIWAEDYKNEAEKNLRLAKQKIFRERFEYWSLNNDLPLVINNNYHTRAWLKFYEIVKEFGLMDISDDVGEFMFFDNASFPGAFIVAANHLAAEKKMEDIFEWRAMGYISSKSNILEDSASLYKNHSSNWLMTENIDGDLSKKTTIDHIRNELGGNVDLYSGDMGSIENYTHRTCSMFSAFVGEMLSMIISLRKGGSGFIKLYIVYGSYLVDVMYIVSSFFQECYLYKPYTSDSSNDEFYFVCNNFCGLDPESDSKDQIILRSYISRLYDYLDKEYIKSFDEKFDEYEKKYKDRSNIEDFDKYIPHMSCFSKDMLDTDFYKSLLDGVNQLINRQIFRVNEILELIDVHLGNNSRAKIVFNHSKKIDEWLIKYNPKRIKSDRLLNVQVN